MDGPILRREAVHAALLANHSATAVLERLCGAPIHVQRLAPDSEIFPDAVPELAANGHVILARHVQLLSGALILSHARLAYLPGLLPQPLALELTTTDQPFGRVLRRLGLHRATLAARLCDAGEDSALEHRALLHLPDGRPLALVEEHYGWALFAGS